MQRKIDGALAAGAFALLLAGCAGGGYDNEQPFNVWVNQVQQACYYQNIGVQQVGSLIQNQGTTQGNYFLDQLERLFNGRITKGQFVSGVTGFLDGRESDPGIQCVLDRVPASRPKPPLN
jgi:hypothetical protein